ncbi:MAG: tRNA 2-thiouridine(34) synthase MnmA [Microthrixaceae bacterium]
MKVLAALSGGVDSSVAAAVLLDAGHEVVGATLKLWGGASDSGCCSVADVEDARRCAAQLGIDHHVFNYTDAFDRLVVDPYVEEHVRGNTPNPCIECNRHLKFDALLRRAEVLGFDAVATGHHARRVMMADRTWRIGRGEDSAKDQSYVLYTVTGADLEQVLFPIGEMTKSEVRRIAGERGLRTASKPESQDVCFITRADGRQAFLSERVELHRGTVVDSDGTTVGSTDAVELVTIGQRKGLNLSGGSKRRFATAVDVRARTVTVGGPDDLLADWVRLGSVVWASGVPGGADHAAGIEVTAQCSAHGHPASSTLRVAEDGQVDLEWHVAQPKVAPGQSVVFYQNRAGASGEECGPSSEHLETVVGGGIALGSA